MSSYQPVNYWNKLKEQASLKWQELTSKPYFMIGTATCGRAAGALAIKDILMTEISRHGLEAAVIDAGCMGHCYAEPIVVAAVPGFPTLCYGQVNEGIAERLVKDFLINGDPCFEFAMAAVEPNDYFPAFQDFPRGVYEHKLLLQWCGFINPEDINHYIYRGGYRALATALTMSPEEIIATIKDSGLRGRGGAGFPTGLKWEACYRAPGKPKYVICNADEGDPGAFMDRTLLESNPHAVLEGMIIAALAVGAEEGIIYVRAEYPLAIQRLSQAIQAARALNLLGNNIMGSGRKLEIKLFQGAGAFVCGEETALIASLEGKAGLPRVRPPYPSEAGLYGCPTLTNNVKTFSYVPLIINHGAEWFRSTGTESSPGTALFALAGKVTQTGIAEVPMGTTLRTLIFDVGGGIAGGKEFKAVQIGGPSGGCLPQAMLDTPIDFDSLTQAGAMMGSGGIVVLDEDDCMVEIARYFLDFTQKESCGKCTFCRLGTKHMLDILTRITRGEGRPEDLTILHQLAEDVKAGSLCGLGRTAPNPVLTTLRYFLEEYKAHIYERRCPARMCKELTVYYILPHKCERSCDACVGSCPVEAIYTNDDRIKVINQSKCVKCNSCMEACPPQYKAVVKLSPPSLLNGDLLAVPLNAISDQLPTANQANHKGES